MNERLHVDLFSGLAGFALAARANGLRTVQFCEIDPKCRAFLARAWPGVPIHDDIRTFGADWGVADGSCEGRREIAGGAYGDEGEDAGRGAKNDHESSGDAKGGIYLLTGGPPCQPVSVAGKQRGREDDRFLWDETIAAIARVRPTWFLLENPSGIRVHLDGILAALESAGYEVGTVDIPACAVNSPHRRARYWLIGRRTMDNPDTGLQRQKGEVRTGRAESRVSVEQAEFLADACQEGREGPDATPRADGLYPEHHEGKLAHTDAAGLRGEPNQHRGDSFKEIRAREEKPRRRAGTQWDSCVWLSCADGKLRRAPDDSFGLVDGLHRSVLGALGNSIVPQIAEKIIAAMIEADKELQNAE